MSKWKLLWVINMKRYGCLLELEVGSSMKFKQLLQPLLGLMEPFSSKLPAILLINSSTSTKNSAPIDLVSPLDFSLHVDSDSISKLRMLCRMLVASFGASIISFKVPDSSRLSSPCNSNFATTWSKERMLQ